MTDITINGFDFRVKKMSAVEVLAIKTFISVDDVNKLEESILSIVSKFEVKVKDEWLPCYKSGVMLPAILNDDPVMLDKLTSFFTHDYLIPLFLESKRSNDEQK